MGEHTTGTRGLVGAVLGGGISGAIAVTIGISFAALIYQGDLADSLPTGLGLTLAGSGIMGLIVAWRSAFPFAVAGAQDSTAAILGVAVSGLVSQVDGAPLPTTLAVIAVATVFAGVAMFTVGRLRLGEVARYMPFPVVGGFLAATGFLLVQGAVGILGDGQGGGDLLDFDSAMVWIPGLLIGIGLWAAGRFLHSALAMPVALLTVTVVWRLGIAVGGVGEATAMARGWLLGPFPGDVAWHPDVLRTITDADWSVVAGAWLPILSIALVSVISLLLHVPALEHISAMDVDANRELRVGGVAGIVAGAFGGLPGFMFFSDSALLHRFGGGRRIAALLAAALPLVVIGFGTEMLGLIPVAVLGGILFYLGLSFVVEWLWDARERLGRVDHLLVLGIATTAVVIGFLAAIGLGVAIAIGLFAVRYSRVDAVRRTYTLQAVTSTLDRPHEQREALGRHGAEVRVVEVHGFLFFGTASGLFGAHQLDPGEGGTAPRVLVYDLRDITGIDSSTAMAFQRFDRQAAAREVTLVLAGLPERFRRAIAPALAEARAAVREFSDVDAALQWCEDAVLDRVLGTHQPVPTADIGALVAGMLGGSEPAAAILRHARRLAVEAGARVIRAGEPRPGLFFLESGRLSVLLDRPDGTTMRLRQMLAGSVIGEISLYRGGEAAADVVADDASVVWHIPADDIDRLDRDDPAAAAAIHRFAASLLAERMVHANLRATRA